MTDQELSPRLLVREQVLECTRCELHKNCQAPVPFSGPTPAKIAVVGEAPGADEDQQGEPFIGRSGQLLRQLLADAGFVLEELFICNTAQCFPRGTPTPDQVAACRPNKLAQLDLADPQWVLVLGSVALAGFRPDLKISKARARPFKPLGTDYVCFASYHPAAALRNKLYQRELAQDLVTFRAFTRLLPQEWVGAIEDRCVACGNWMIWLDAEGVPWCEGHLPAEGVDRLEFLRRDYAAACARLKETPP